MKYISEDNRWHSPASYLADVVYGKENTKFSCGNGKLKIQVDKLKDTGEEIIVYVDLVPGNYHTYRVFRELLKRYKDYGNIYIVPILSTEACVVESLKQLGVNIDSQIQDILQAKIKYKGTKYKNEDNLEHVTKKFYKDISLLKDDLSYYKDKTVEICGKSISLEERGVMFILAHVCYLSNIVISKYSNDEFVSLESYIEEYLNYYNRLAAVNDLLPFPDKFNYKCYVEGKGVKSD